MPTTDQLLTALDFKREEMVQLLLVFTLLAMIAMSIVMVLLSTHERSRLRSFLFITLTCSTLLFILATIVDAIILPGMRLAAIQRSVAQIFGFIALSRVVVLAGCLGMILLVAGIGVLGYLHSRWVGRCVLGATTAVAAAFIACCVYLNYVAHL